jgi:ribose transport system substrate-binding protein
MQYFLKSAMTAGVFALSMCVSHAEIASLNSDADADADRMDCTELEAKFGALAAPAAGTKTGGVSKTLTNEYWRSLGQG